MLMAPQGVQDPEPHRFAEDPEPLGDGIEHLR